MIKKIGVIFLSVVLVIGYIAPFSIFADESGAEADDLGYIAAQQFFAKYNLQRYESNGHQIICTTSGTTQSCNISAANSNSVGHWYNIMNIPAGLSFNRYTAYSTSNRFRVTTEPLYLVFLSSTNFTDDNITLYPQSGYSATVNRVTNNYQTVMTPDGFYLTTLKVVATSTPSSGTTWVTLDLPGTSSTTVVPIYKGAADTMPDNVHRVVFGTGQTFNTFDTITHNYLSTLNDRMATNNAKLDVLHNDLSIVETKLDTIHTDLYNNGNILQNIRNGVIATNQQLITIRDYLLSGDSSTSSSVSNLDDKTSDLTSITSDLNDFESDLSSDLSTQMNAIDINASGSIISNNNFLLTSNWVRTQYNRMINNNPFGSMISFSLVIGLSLLIIGKLRK